MSENVTHKLPFASDYQQGAHPSILECLSACNFESHAGYGSDTHCARARTLIRHACEAPEAEVHFLVGGTQANAVVIAALLAPWQGVVAAISGHINGHEVGAVEATGHKILSLPATDGKLLAADVEALAQRWENDENREHMVMPGLVYISQPTESGTLYTKAELKALRSVCDAHGMKLYVDGARLAYALAAPENDVTLPDLAGLADAFYIGGTKCGALLGEAVVFPDPASCPYFFSFMKQKGALLAKGMLLGIQFECLFEDGLYLRIGQKAVEQAARIAKAVTESSCELTRFPETNQIFIAFDDEQLADLSKEVIMSFWGRRCDGKTVMRLATSWASTDEEVDALIALLKERNR